MSLVSISTSVGRNLLDFYDQHVSSSFPTWAHLPLLGAATIGAGTTAYWYLKGEPTKPVKHLVDLSMQTRQLPDGSRISAFLKDDKLIERSFEDAKTLYEAVRRGLRVSNNGPMLGYRKKQQNGSEPYVWLSYGEVINRSENLARGMSKMGVRNGQQSLIGIYSKNRPEWVIGELATYNLKSVLIPLYTTLGKDARSFIINQAEIETIICENEEKANDLLNCEEKCPTLKYLVLMDQFSKDLAEKAKINGVTVCDFATLENNGRDLVSEIALTPPSPDDLCTICYTSGTTGMPKGVMLTHANIIASTTVLQSYINVVLETTDVLMSYLPLAHMYERVAECAVFQHGCRVGFFRGDIRTLVDDIKELRPTLIPLVPRVLSRIYDKVMAEVNKSFMKRTIFSLALSYKAFELRRGIKNNDSFFDRYIFNRIRNQFGGRIRLMVTGSAPLAGDVLTFARIVFGCFVVEGYGQTECAATCTTACEADFSTCHVGIPLSCNAIKLVDVPDLGYFAAKGAGEICVRGHNVFKGYFKNEEMTNETLDKDGWLHSGDIGKWNENGTLRLIDRKKNIFKLQQGEYIAPDKIENAYAHSELVAQSFVYGESLKTCLIGIIVPEEEALTELAATKLGLKNVSFKELCLNPELKKLVLEDIIETGRRVGLLSFEQVKDIYLTSERFSIENDLLTPTLKSKRPQLKKRYASQLNLMYSKLK